MRSLRKDFSETATRRRELTQAQIQDVVGYRQIEVSNGAGQFEMVPQGNFIAAARKDRDAAIVLVNSGFCMFMDKDEQGIIQHSSGTFGNGLELGDEIGKFFDVPTTDVAQDTLPFSSRLTRRFSIAVRIVMMTG